MEALSLLLLLWLSCAFNGQGIDDLVGEAPEENPTFNVHHVPVVPATPALPRPVSAAHTLKAAAVVVAVPQHTNGAMPSRFTYVTGWQQCMFLKALGSSEQLCLPSSKPRECDQGSWWALWDLLGSEISLCDGKRPKFTTQQRQPDGLQLMIQTPFATSVRWYYPAAVALAPSLLFILIILIVAMLLRC